MSSIHLPSSHEEAAAAWRACAPSRPPRGILSFKAAADELGVTPTAISHQIRQLEELCGHALFRRRPRPLALTACGAQLFPVMNEGLDSFAAAMAGIAGEAAAAAAFAGDDD